MVKTQKIKGTTDVVYILEMTSFDLFLKSNSPLKFIINGGEELILIPEHNKIQNSMLIGFEYKVSPQQLQKIAYANSINVKISTANYETVRSFDESNLYNFRKFYEDHIMFEKDWTPNGSYQQPFYNVKKDSDEFENIEIISLVDNYLNGEHRSGPKGTIYFNIVKGANKKQKVLLLNIRYESENWVFLQPGDVVFLIDGQKNVLRSDGEVKRNVSSGKYLIINENLNVIVAPEFLKKIIDAKDVEIRMRSERGFVDRSFSRVNLYNIKRFYEEIIENKLPN